MRPWLGRSRRSKTETGASEVIHLFLLWPAALGDAERILEDLNRRFSVLELIRVEWSPDRFTENLERFYGPLLPEGVDKQSEAGSGDFLVAIVADKRPRYRPRERTVGKALVNANVFDAKQLYRRWTGGGHRVHATNDSEETARDLFLLFGRGASDILRPLPGRGAEIHSFRGDLIGARQWRSLDEMLRTLELCGGYVLLEDEHGLPTVLAHDPWVVRIARAQLVGEPRLFEIATAEGPVQLVLSWLGDGSLPLSWQRVILTRPRRDPYGRLVASSVDTLYLKIRVILQSGGRPSADQICELENLAAETGMRSATLGDPEALARMFAAFVESVGVAT